MTTKIKKNKSSRGRPKKDFGSVVVKNTDKALKRGRGRPKKGKKANESINTKISNHNKEINKISKKNEKIHLDIKNASFVSKKIDKNKSNKSDNFALGLLIFSMILFIFSLYKTFYLNSYDPSQEEIKEQNIINENVENNYIDNDIFLDTGSILKRDVSKESKKEDKDKNQILSNDININIINSFYTSINNQNFDALNNMVDSYLKTSNVFRTYYNSNRLSNFVGSLANKKLYITNIKETKLDQKKDGVTYYSFVIKYKLNNNNELFQEGRETAIVTRGEQKLIGSLRCITTGCSKMPFFNLSRYEK